MRLIFSEHTTVVQTFRSGAGYPVAPPDTGEFITDNANFIMDGQGNFIMDGQGNFITDGSGFITDGSGNFITDGSSNFIVGGP